VDNFAVQSCQQCGAVVPRTARFCPSCGNMISDERPAEERKLATVLFADLVGSTALADSTDAERTRVVLNRFYDAMAAEIADMGGTIEKFIGDAVVAAFGAPAALEDHADRALHAALSMRGRLAELFGDTLALRIGVNTGDVVVGEPRVGSSFVTGDAVNVAARLEQAARAGEILVGERTAAAARSAFEFGESASIPAKGKPGGVVCRRLIRARSDAVRAGAVFVGREAELEALQGAFAAVVANARPRRMTIVGEAGVGKTALAREFVAWLALQPLRSTVHVGRCLAYGRASAYFPLGQIVRALVGGASWVSRSASQRRHTFIHLPFLVHCSTPGPDSSRSSPRSNRQSFFSRTCTGRSRSCSTFSPARLKAFVGHCWSSAPRARR
jgi:class 3 adenylate cyclase